MLWHCQSDPRFHYQIYIPPFYNSEEAAEYKLVVIVHGTGRDNTEYWNEAKKFANEKHVALLAPVFPAGLFETFDLNSYRLLNCGGIRYDLILLNMIDEMERRFPRIRTDKFFMFGFSGGGQFTNRFLFVHPERLAAVSIGAPGRPTYLNFKENYFWGVKDFREQFDKELNISAVAKVPVELMVGDQDTLFIGESSYGTTRVERMRNLKDNFEQQGIYVELDLLPGLNHVSGRSVKIQTALRFFEKYL